jgi:Ser-tRNA(Ala) deacylase AlaX
MKSKFFGSDFFEKFIKHREALVKENENIKFLFESKKTFNEEELIKTIENMRNEMYLTKIYIYI